MQQSILHRVMPCTLYTLALKSDEEKPGQRGSIEPITNYQLTSPLWFNDHKQGQFKYSDIVLKFTDKTKIQLKIVQSIGDIITPIFGQNICNPGGAPCFSMQYLGSTSMNLKSRYLGFENCSVRKIQYLGPENDKEVVKESWKGIEDVKLWYSRKFFESGSAKYVIIFRVS